MLSQFVLVAVWPLRAVHATGRGELLLLAAPAAGSGWFPGQERVGVFFGRQHEAHGLGPLLNGPLRVGPQLEIVACSRESLLRIYLDPSNSSRALASVRSSLVPRTYLEPVDVAGTIFWDLWRVFRDGARPLTQPFGLARDVCSPISKHSKQAAPGWKAKPQLVGRRQRLNFLVSIEDSTFLRV